MTEEEESRRAAMIHMVNEQIQNNDPPEARQAFHRLVSEGYSEEEAKVLIAQCLVIIVFDVVKSGKPAEDSDIYLKSLNNLPKLPNDDSEEEEDELDDLELNDIDLDPKTIASFKNMIADMDEDELAALQEEVEELEKLDDDELLEVLSQDDKFAELFNEFEEPILERKSPEPAIPKIGRNDLVTVKYLDGTIKENVKFKKVQNDVSKGFCKLI